MKVCADPPYLDTAKCRCLGYAMKHSLPRSALFMPGSNTRAMEKARTLDCDAVILDLEDSVAPDAKDGARANVQKALGEGGFGKVYKVESEIVNLGGDADSIHGFSCANSNTVS